MNRSIVMRLLAAAVLIAAEIGAVTALLVVTPTPAGAGLFEDLFPFFQQRNRRGWFDRPEREERAPDYSKAPAPKKTDAVPQTPIMVFGDSLADWLGYGLEQAFADTPEVGVLRQHRTSSGLIRSEVRNDPRGEYPDWPQAAREMIAAQKPKFVVMMIGLNDRKQIKEVVQSVRAKPAVPAKPEPIDPAARELDTPEPRPVPDAVATAPEAPGPGGTKTYEFRSDAWNEAYIRRIDNTIAALKTAGGPIFWVGLPPMRGGRAAADIPFLNDLYRSRADKAGIVYVDVWDGFVDEDGRFAQSGPDFEGQTRRLRSGDGVYFTQAGARKLAHFVEREIDRWLNSSPVAVAIPVEAKAPTSALEVASGKGGISKARPLFGPAVPLIPEGSGESEELLGGNARSKITDAVALKVLEKGEAMPIPAGRADDFAWPRRTVAPVGADPVVATTDLPMTPMVAERGSATAAAIAAATPVAPQPPRRIRSAEYQQLQYRPDFFRRQFNFFPFLFGGGR